MFSFIVLYFFPCWKYFRLSGLFFADISDNKSNLIDQKNQLSALIKARSYSDESVTFFLANRYSSVHLRINKALFIGFFHDILIDTKSTATTQAF